MAPRNLSESSWTWKERGVEHGVQIYEDRLHWWSDPPDPDKRWAGGGAADQTIEAFINNGPQLRSCPLRILRKLVAAFEIEEADWWRRRLAKVKTPRKKKTVSRAKKK